MRLTLMTLFCLFPVAAWAGDDWLPPVTDPVVQKECGTCHMAFQPGFLPARSWAVLMDGLANHFGDNASLPMAQAQTIREYLTRNAGDAPGLAGHGKTLASKAMRGIAAGDVPVRITQTPLFLREHRMAETVWRNPAVTTKSNCPACHIRANQGWYDED